MPAMALSRVGARVVESGPDGENLAPGAWQRLEALPDPRSPQGRIYPLACLIAIALCAFTAAGNDRFTAVGQWIRRAGQADLARLHAPWDPIAGRYRAPDEKTDPDGPGPSGPASPDPGPARPAPAPAPGRAALGQRAPLPGPARRPAGKNAGPGPVKGVAVDGKTSRGARRPDGTRVHLLGVAEHGGHLLDHLEVDVKHNETSHFTELLESLDLAGAVVTFDALHTVRANLDWLATEKKAHYIAVVKQNQPLLHARVKALPWRQVPAGSITRGDRARPHRDPHREGRPRQPPGLPAGPARPSRSPAGGRTPRTGTISRETVYAVTSLTSAHATAQDLARLVREHWTIEAHHHVRSPGRAWPLHHVAPTRHGWLLAADLLGCGARGW